MSQVFHEVKPLCSWYHSNFGISTANQLIMLCVQATMMMLLPELWIFMLWPPMLLHLIYQSVDIASTAVDNCCIHLLWIYAASNRCEYTAATAVVFCPLLWISCRIYWLCMDILLPWLWILCCIHLLWTYCCHCCGPLLDFHCCGSVQSTLPATDSSVI